MYRQHIAQDAFGNITQANLGNGVTEYRDYDSATGWVQSLEGRVGGVAVHQLNYTGYDNFGNLLGYSNGATGVSESYIYDNLHRLESQTTSAAGVSAAVSFSYDAVGNLLSKSDYGSNYLYGNRAKSLGGNAGANAVRRVTKTDGSTVNFNYDNEGNLISGDGLTISYNSFKQPTQISRGSSTFSFTYGANLERLKEVRDGLTTYEIDKAYEQSSDGSWKVYLDEVAIISHNSEDGHRIAYSHKDRLGSSITFTDHNGQVTGRRHYDAFGKPRAISGALMEPAHRPRQINFTDIAGISNAGITRRGFTDHRHLDEAELIHMNGRAYDYNLGRFLSVDPVIQSPGNSQSLNPYSYIMNNPLAGTDPTGYFANHISGCGAMCDKYGGGGNIVNHQCMALCVAAGASSSEDKPDNGADKDITASKGAGQAITDIGTQQKLSGTGSVGQNANQEDGGYLSTASGFVKGLAQSFLDSQAQAFAGGIGIQDTDSIQSSIQISTTESESGGVELAESAENNAGMLSSTVGMLANLRTADFTPDQNIIRGSLSLLVTDGKIDATMLRTFVPEHIRNTFGPTDDIPAGQKYKFNIGDTRVVIKWHSPQGIAKMNFPNPNSGNMWTAQVQVGNKFLTTDGKWVRQAKRDDTHIPVIR
ncbi:RHS repeat domain-containing protein [Rheinheimera gaetbuli]